MSTFRSKSPTRAPQRKFPNVEKKFEPEAIDKLTGLMEQAAFLEKIREEVQRAVRFERPVSLLALSFARQQKSPEFNPRLIKGYGTLRQLGNVVRLMLRDIDVAGRLDAEVLGLLLPETSLEGARVVGERICAKIATHEFPGETLESLLQLEINVGYAAYPYHGLEADILLACAQVALISAQEMGQSQVVPAKI